MNKGHCENCWWFKTLHKDCLVQRGRKYIRIHGDGNCFLLTPNDPIVVSNKHVCEAFKKSYLHTDESLDEWIKEHTQK